MKTSVPATNKPADASCVTVCVSVLVLQQYCLTDGRN